MNPAPSWPLLLLVLLILPPIAWAQQDRLEIIELHHRSAEDLIPLVQPLLAAEDAISGRGYQLIVRTTPARLRQLRELVAQLDTAPQRLLISVRQADQAEDSRTAAGVSGRVDLGDGHGVVFGDGRPRDSWRAEVAQGDRHRRDQLLQQVQVLDGGEAYIQVGQQVPRRERILTQQGWTVRSQDYTVYQPLTSGFYVRPQLHGDTVTLWIAPHRQRERADGSGRVDSQALTTTVSGRLGEWLELGGSREDRRQQRQGLTGYDSRREQQRGRILLKVERLP
jgi:hypothetical protein